MKKFLAIFLACSMLFAFAACGGNTEDETTTAAPETTTAAVEDTTAAEETTLAIEETTLAIEETTVAPETTTAAEETTAALSTTEEIVAFYNAAVVKTDEPAPQQANRR